MDESFIHQHYTRAKDLIYHPSDSPIELMWACVKGRVGRQYSVDTTFKDVRRRLEEAFDSLPADVIYKCIENSKPKWCGSTSTFAI
jgi:hypothetical protein